MSDSLRQLADGEHVKQTARGGAGGATVTRPSLSSSANAVDVFDESGLHAGLQAAAHAAPSRSKRGPATVHTTEHTLRLLAAAVLFLMGFAVAGLASWSTMVLAGFDVWRSDMPGAREVAMMLLVAYPLAMCLLGGGTLVVKQVARDKKRQAGYRMR
ncbi:MAG: hypothetical protein WD534_07755 [Phycisphaeraceae bacterium]